MTFNKEASENTEREPAVSRLHGTVEPSYPLSWFAGKSLPGNKWSARKHPYRELLRNTLAGSGWGL
jgi:hypothetical protein